jgi:hypothetical protein
MGIGENHPKPMGLPSVHSKLAGISMNLWMLIPSKYDMNTSGVDRWRGIPGGSWEQKT